MKVAISSSELSTAEKLQASVGVFLPGVELQSVNIEGTSAILTFHITGGFDMKVMNAVMGKLLRLVPKGTKLGKTRFAGKSEPFTLTLEL